MSKQLGLLDMGFGAPGMDDGDDDDGDLEAELAMLTKGTGQSGQKKGELYDSIDSTYSFLLHINCLPPCSPQAIGVGTGTGSYGLQQFEGYSFRC